MKGHEPIPSMNMFIDVGFDRLPSDAGDLATNPCSRHLVKSSSTRSDRYVQLLRRSSMGDLSKSALYGKQTHDNAIIYS